MDEDEAMMIQLKAVLGAMADIVRSTVRGEIRTVLERNESIVYQSPAALDHLCDELVAVILPEIPWPTK